jgi:ABC-2 type transport system ATP-binding protein
MENILEIKSLRKEYEEFILDNIDLSLPKGYIMGIIGPNGAGKTTTIKLIMNFIQRNGGSVEIFGLDNTRHEKEIKNRIGYVGEEQYFYEYRNAVWTGRFVSHFYDRWDQKKYLSFLEKFEIPPKQRIKKYSKGMKVKLSMAIALSHAPEFIILDEPTSGLDPVVRHEILDHLMEISRQKETTVLISSHITDDLERIADLISYMIQGRIVLNAPKVELLANWKKIHFTGKALDGEILKSLHKLEKHMFGASGITKNYQELKSVLAPGIEREEIKVENIGLDDILISLVEED